MLQTEFIFTFIFKFYITIHAIVTILVCFVLPVAPPVAIRGFRCEGEGGRGISSISSDSEDCKKPNMSVTINYQHLK